MANPEEWNEVDLAILRVQFPLLFMFENDPVLFVCIKCKNECPVEELCNHKEHEDLCDNCCEENELVKSGELT